MDKIQKETITKIINYYNEKFESIALKLFNIETPEDLINLSTELDKLSNNMNGTGQKWISSNL